MKKILMLLLIALFSFSTWAVKTVNYDTVQAFQLTCSPCVHNRDNQLYYLMRVDYFCEALSEDGASERRVFAIEYYGTGKSTPYTYKEWYAWLRGIPNLHLILTNKAKDLFTDAINEDISQ